ncbi:MAG: hypothetical protein AAGA42_11225 [Actinomycetota bacterium]
MSNDDRNWAIETATWVSQNTAAAIAVLTAFGVGAAGIILWSFGEGLGVAPAELGLDVRQSLILAGAAGVYPMLLLGPVAGTNSLSRGGRWARAASTAIVTASSIIAYWWVGAAILPAFALGLVAGSGVAAARRFARRRRQLADRMGDSPPTTSTSGVSLFFIATAIVQLAGAVIIFSFGSYYAGTEVRRDSDQSSAFGPPPPLRYVLSVQRGEVTTDAGTACVDKIGNQLFVGNESAVVTTEWRAFEITDCQRGDAGEIVGP